MTTVTVLYHLMRADFLERVRRYSFLIVLGLTIYLGYLFVPPADADYVTVSLGAYRGVYNSAWIGGMMAILTVTLLTLPGFYLVKNAIERDERTGVGQIIAATPVRKPLYLVGKWLSNVAVLAVMVAALTLAAGTMQWIRGEDLRLDLWALTAPFVFVVLPALAMVAAVAVLFETLGWLRGGLGNVVYFFVWNTVLISTFIRLDSGITTSDNDVLGLTTILAGMTDAARAAFPNYDGGVIIGASEASGPLQTFVWMGTDWTAFLIAGRLLWVGVAAGVALLATLFFNRFDSSREKMWGSKGAGVLGSNSVNSSRLPGEASILAPWPHLTLSPIETRFNFFTLLLAELRLLLKGQRWWWYVIAGGLIVISLINPANVARERVLMLAWVWPVLIWSALGARETYHGVGPIVFTALRPLQRQLPAAWLAGVLVTALAGAGVAARLLIAGDGMGLLAWCVGVAFIPSLALALGVWSGDHKLFEVVYVTWWYFGPVNGLPALDFMGATGQSAPLAYLLVTLALLGAALAGRWRQLRH